MTGYIILIAFVVYAVSVLGAFISGYSKGRKAEQNEQNEQNKEKIRKAERDKAFQVKKETIQKEVFGNAEEKKANISSGSGVDKFNAINNVLRYKPKN